MTRTQFDNLVAKMDSDIYKLTLNDTQRVWATMGVDPLKWLAGSDLQAFVDRYNAIATELGGFYNVDTDTSPTRGDKTMQMVQIDNQEFDIAAVRNLMDDEICEQLHNTCETEQSFVDEYMTAHYAKYKSNFVVN